MKTDETPINQIPKIIEEFDFETVQKVMQFIGWKWQRWPGAERVPTVLELEETAIRLLKIAVECGGAASGGFYANVETSELGEKYLSLEFILESTSIQ